MTTLGRDLTTELFAAVNKDDSKAVSWLIGRNADVNQSAQNGWTPLMLALLHGFVSVAEILLLSGADPNLATQSEENPCRLPLAVAIGNGRVECVRLLIKHGADVNAPLPQGGTVLELARRLSLRPFHKDEILDIIPLLKERDEASLQPFLAVS